MTVSAQTAYNGDYSLLPDSPSGQDMAGQRFTAGSIAISKIGLLLSRTGSPGGTINFTIRQADGNPGTLLASTALTTGANSIATTRTWYEAVFGTIVNVSGTIRILAAPTAGTTNNFIKVGIQTSDVKASENACTRPQQTGWVEDAYDAAYYYAYEASAGSAAGTLGVSTQAISSISGTTATGNGRLDSFAVTTGVTQHGHCWDTATNPSTALATKTTNGSTAVLGAFTSGIITLTPGTLYYVRAYATDASTTVYGVNATFTAGDIVSGAALTAYEIAVVQTRLHYVGDDGVERFVEGSTTT